ncbi:MAG: hypothetical protein ACPGTP_09380, partial [Bacteroidia bacterium]
MDKSTTIETLCAYCESSCDDDLVSIKGKVFCCYGCATLSDVVANMKNMPLEVSLKYKQFDLKENFESDQFFVRPEVSISVLGMRELGRIIKDLLEFHYRNSNAEA